MKTTWSRKTVFVAYLIILFGITELSVTFHPAINFSIDNANYNLYPFAFIKNGMMKLRYLNGMNGLWPVLKDVFLGFLCNIVLFLPFGYLLPQLGKKNVHMKSVLLKGLLLSASIELMQLFTSVAGLVSDRVFDVDDILANVLGSALGFALYIKSARCGKDPLKNALDVGNRFGRPRQKHINGR